MEISIFFLLKTTNTNQLLKCFMYIESKNRVSSIHFVNTLFVTSEDILMLSTYLNKFIV